ncbi:hypothetical protein [Haloarchaeobius sp. HRN-SO-5]|uniref:hypothetical protein n=1 Tax=Haloarchaeobius sp. HRN-SO-5 TaxID=3446118 RepID=UPI003EB9D1B7
MTDRDRRDRLTEYVAVLRGFGLTDDEILGAHDLELVPDGFDLAEYLAHEFDLGDERALYRRLHEALAGSVRGIDADREYWSHAPAAQLDEACGTHGWQVDLTGDDPLTVSVTTPDGETRRATFEYPESSLGEHNYPALAAAVESLLDGLTLALLSDVDGRWRFVVVEPDLLADLRDRYGERVRVFRRPLLRAEQPADFASDATAESDRESNLAGIAGDAFAESVGTGPRVHRSSRPLETELETTPEPERIVGESIEPVFETLAETDPAKESDEVVDTQVETLLSDLDRPERQAADDGDPGSEETTVESTEVTRTHVSETVEADDDASAGFGLVGGGPKTTVVEDDLDDVFASIEGTNPPAEAAEADHVTTDELLSSVDEPPAAGGDAETGAADDGGERRVEADRADPPEQVPDLSEESFNFDEWSGSEGDSVEGVTETSTGVEPAETAVPDDGPGEPSDAGDVTTAHSDDGHGTVAFPDEGTDEDEDVPAGADDDAGVPLDGAGGAIETGEGDDEGPDLFGEESARLVDDDLADDAPVGGDPPDGMDVGVPDETGADEDADPSATPSIDEIEIDVDDGDVPAFDNDDEDDEPTGTDGPLAGSLHDASTGPTGTADATAETSTDEEYPDVVVGRLDEGDSGPIGRFVAWLRGLF